MYLYIEKHNSEKVSQENFVSLSKFVFKTIIYFYEIQITKEIRL